MADKIEYSRLLLKRTNIAGVVPTVPPLSAVTLNQFTPTDVFVGEMFANVEDDRLWIRTNTGIVELNTSGATGTTVVPTLTQVLNEGDNTGGFDISVSEGNTIIYQGLTSGATTQFLGLDVSGNTIIVTGATGGSGTSGTSGSSGRNGTSGSSGINGTSGSSGVSGTSGSSGASGNDGANSNRWNLVDTTGGSNPGSNNFSTDNSDPSLISAVWVNKTDLYGIDQQNWFVDFSTHLLTDLQTGYFQVKKLGSNDVIATYSPTGYTSFSSGTWFKIDLVPISVGGTFTTGNTYSLSWVFNGVAGSSGSAGSSGTSGTNGSSGVNGTSGSSGINGTSGTSGTSGSSGRDGTSGSSGINGTSGSSGINGTSGSSGINGTSGSSGINGTSGSSGIGTSGSSGTSGLSGVNGTSGTSGNSGSSGTSGSSGRDGNFLGSSGTSGSSGRDGTSGTGGGGGGATGTHFAWELSKNSRYNLSLTSEYHEIEWNLWRNQMTLFPFTPARDVNVSGFSMSTTFTAGTPGTPQIVMCAYDHNPTTNLPGNLILSSSTITLEFPFVQHKYTTNYTFSAGTTYWLGYGFNDMDSVTAGFAVTYEGLMTFAAPNTHCCDEPYKFAINTSYTFPTLPNPFTGSRYLGNEKPPEICILPR